jgi:hypothetical protein
MRYNKDTERGIQLDQIADQCRNAIKNLPQPVPAAKVWHAGQWVTNPLLTAVPA